MRKFLRVFIISLFILIFLYLFFNLALAWSFVFILTHPVCRSPVPIPGWAAQEYWLQSEPDRQIRVWYYPTKNNKVIITLGGMEGALGDRLPVINFLLDQGYGILQIDSRACAKPRGVVTLGIEETEDALAGYTFLRTFPEVKKIGAFGYSMGAAALIQAAAREKGIQAVVAEGGYYNLGDDIVETDSSDTVWRKIFLYTIAASYRVQTGYNPWESDPIGVIPFISPQAIFLIYGEKEAESGQAQWQYLQARQPKALWIVPDGDHGTNYTVLPVEYEYKIIEFFEQHLRNDIFP